MYYHFDLRTPGIRHNFGFWPDAVAAFRVPTLPQEKLSLLVWGLLIDPAFDHSFLDMLAKNGQQDLTQTFYYAGWGRLAIHGIHNCLIQVRPYAPRFLPGDLHLLKDADGDEVCLTRSWDGISPPTAIDFGFEFILEQPLGYMALSGSASGSIDLAVNPASCVPLEQVKRSPELYSYDFTRSRQILNTNDIP